MPNHKCDCVFCQTHDKYRWARITECKCFCHSTDEICGHDLLCCEYPNGKKKNNPHENLEAASEYAKILRKNSDERPD